MDFDQFCQHAKLDQNVANYLDDIAQAADPHQTDRSVGLDVLFAMAAYALYRLAKNYLDQQRGLAEAELRQQLLEQVETLVKGGWSRDKALAAALAVSKDVATLRPDTPALKGAIALLKA
jgi:hypothetical protein